MKPFLLDNVKHEKTRITVRYFYHLIGYIQRRMKDKICTK